MWELDYEEGWTLKNWCFFNCVVVEDSWGPLECKEIKPVNLKGNQSWIFIRRTNAKAEAPIFWPPDAKYQLIGKGPDAGKDWRQEEKGMTEDEMDGWHHWLHGGESEQSSGRWWRTLACYSPWGCSQTRLSDWTTSTTDLLKTSYFQFPMKG